VRLIESMFRRRYSASPETESESAAASGAAGTDTPSQSSGKGRPTPTRKEAEAARKQRMAPPRTRKEASQRQREQVRSQRAKVRQAMETGEERYLPARDRGPVKRFVRDWVDSHRTVGEFLIPIFFLIFILVAVNNQIAAAIGTWAWLTVLVAMVADSIRVMRGVKKGLRERFGPDATKGITFYTLTRSWQIRRFRLPKPQVKPGDSI
jgi:hypothetical protein